MGSKRSRSLPKNGIYDLISIPIIFRDLKWLKWIENGIFDLFSIKDRRSAKHWVSTLFLKPSLLNILSVNIWKAKVIQRFAYFGIAILDLRYFFDAFKMLTLQMYKTEKWNIFLFKTGHILKRIVNVNLLTLCQI